MRVIATVELVVNPVSTLLVIAVFMFNYDKQSIILIFRLIEKLTQFPSWLINISLPTIDY